MSAAPLLSAQTRVALAAPLEVMARLREHFVEHGEVSGSDECWKVRFTIGTAQAEAHEDAATFRVTAQDTTSLSYLQWGVAEHVGEFAPDESPEIVWTGGERPGAALPYFREMRVVRTKQITPHMRRITLKGENLERFAHDGMHVRLLLAPAKGIKTVWPVMAADGRQDWPEGPRPVPRVYTIRRIDVVAGEIDIDFVRHEGDEMPGARFGMDALPGDIVGMTGPGGIDLPDVKSYLIFGDETALPAISRMLEEMPGHVKATVMIEIADKAEIQELPTRPDVKLRWLLRNGAPAGSTVLLSDALRALDETYWQDEPFVWAGCEHGAARAIRKFLKGERGLSRKSFLVAAYWRKGQSGELPE